MRYVCLILAASLLASPAWSQKSDDGDKTALFEERKSDFDYLLGEWRFTYVSTTLRARSLEPLAPPRTGDR